MSHYQTHRCRPLTGTLSALTFCTALLIAGTPGNIARAADEKARKLSALLKAPPRSPKGSAKDIAAAKRTTIRVIEILQASNRTNGPSAESFIDTAYSFRDEIGPTEKMVTAAAYLRNWRDAEALGLFDQYHHFQSIIQKGPDKGKNALVEYIVPPSELPQMSKHPANLRIIGPSQKRPEGELQLSARENAHRGQFEQMLNETRVRGERLKVERGTAYTSSGISPDEEHKRWQAAMDAAGEQAKAAPNISLRARTGATPAHKTKYRWRLDAEVINASRHPTKIKLEYWLIGITDKKNRHYIMQKGVKDVELVAGEIEEITLWTGAEGSYRNKSGELDGLPKKQWRTAKVTFRGYVFRAIHETGEVATFATDRNLMQYLDENSDQNLGDLR